MRNTKPIIIGILLFAISLLTACNDNKSKNQEDQTMRFFTDYMTSVHHYKITGKKHLYFVLKPQSGCLSCYKGLRSFLENKDKIPQAKVIVVGKYAPEDLIGLQEVYNSELLFDMANTISNYDLKAYSSGCFIIDNNGQLNWYDYVPTHSADFEQVIEQLQ